MEILNLENTIKAKENLLKQKQKEYDTAKIKEQANTLSSYEVRVIKLSVEKLQAEIALAEKERNIKKAPTGAFIFTNLTSQSLSKNPFSCVLRIL